MTIAARPGGAVGTWMANEANGSKYAMQAVYVELVEPELLVWADPSSGVTTTSTFTDLGDSRTQITIRQTNVPEPFRSPEAQAGFKTSPDRFAVYPVTTADGIAASP